jgi:hypothetical protein
MANSHWLNSGFLPDNTSQKAAAWRDENADALVAESRYKPAQPRLAKWSADMDQEGAIKLTQAPIEMENPLSRA